VRWSVTLDSLTVCISTCSAEFNFHCFLANSKAASRLRKEEKKYFLFTVLISKAFGTIPKVLFFCMSITVLVSITTTLLRTMEVKVNFEEEI